MAGGPSDSQAVAVAKPGGAAAQGGPFHRRPADKRLVKQVIAICDVIYGRLLTICNDINSLTKIKQFFLSKKLCPYVSSHYF